MLESPDLMGSTLEAFHSGSHTAASLADTLDLPEATAAQVLETLLAHSEVLEVVPGLFVRRELQVAPPEAWDDRPTVVQHGFVPLRTGIELWEDSPARSEPPTLEPAPPPVARPPRPALRVSVWLLPVAAVGGFAAAATVFASLAMLTLLV